MRHDLDEFALRFPDLDLTKTRPALFRLNGVGFGLYGRRATDRETGTYVKSHCFCFLWVPLLPIGSYRVADADRGWYILGRQPTNTAERLVRGAVAVGVLVALSALAWTGFTSTDSYRDRETWARAEEAIDAGRLVPAARALQRIARDNPRLRADASGQRAMVDEWLGKREECRGYLDAALAASDDPFTTSMEVGGVLSALGETDGARRHWEQAYESALALYDRAQESAATLNNSALAAQDLATLTGDLPALEDAAARMRKAVAAMPTDVIVMQNAAGALLTLAGARVLGDVSDLTPGTDVLWATMYDEADGRDVIARRLATLPETAEAVRILERCSALAALPPDADARTRIALHERMLAADATYAAESSHHAARVGPKLLIAEALHRDAALRERVRGMDEFARLLEFLEESARKFPDELGPTSWALLRFGTPQQARIARESRPDDVDAMATTILSACSPFAAGSALRQAWMHRAAGDVRDTADGGWSGAAGANQYSLPVLAGAFRGVTTIGEVSRSGYQFRMFLPGAAGVGVTETNVANVFLVDVDNDLCETTWCTYAWPSSHGTSGNRTFFVNQMGDITGTDDRLYSGGDAISEEQAGTAFEPPGALTSITGRPAIGTVGREHGNVWTRVN